MITRAEAITLTKQFIQKKLPSKSWYRNVEPHIKAILLYGSTAKRTNDEDSDIDILIIVPLNIEERYTTGEYFYEYSGQTMNIVLRSIESLRNIAGEHNDKFQKEVFRDCEILVANDSETKDLLSKIADI